MTLRDRTFITIMIICLSFFIGSNINAIRKLQDSRKEVIEETIRNMVINDCLYDKLHIMEVEE